LLLSRARIFDFPIYLAVRLVLSVVQALPLETCARLAKTAAWLLTDVLRLRRSIIEENLSSAFPDKTEPERRALERRMWEHLALLVVEVMHAPRKIHDTNWRDYITLLNQREIVGRLLSDRPVVLVAGHYGNFELSSFMLGLFGFPSYSIARPLDNRFIDRALNQFRGMYGQHILPKQGCAGDVDDLLNSGGTLALLADQHAGPKGCWVDFFGRPASTHKAIGLFSLGSDAPLVMAYCRRVGGPLHCQLGAAAVADPRSNQPEVANVRALTQWYTRRLEEIIQAEPSQYWWLHRRWRVKKANHPTSAAA
jgi:KDO2-lipid IV(A) lauroyltransferase